MPCHQPRPDLGTTVSEVADAKRALRRSLLAARAARAASGAAAATADAERLADVALSVPEIASANCVAAYVSLGTEPATGVLLDRLLASGRTVLLPVLLDDDDLDWAVHTGEFATGRRGLREPVGPRLGVDVVARADAVLVPGLAVSADGQRLGRGGGSYDRALTRVPAGTFTAVLLHADEVGVAVPVEPHDRPVDAAITVAGVRRFPHLRNDLSPRG